MLAFWRRIVAPVAAVAFFGMASVANAETVVFTTSTTFGVLGTHTITHANGDKIAITYNTATLTVANTAPVGSPVTNVQLGSFQVNVTDGNKDGAIANTNVSLPFSFDLVQAFPTGYTQPFTSTIGGNVQFVWNNSIKLGVGSGALTVNLSPDVAILGYIRYELSNDPLTITVAGAGLAKGGSASSLVSPIQANITAVPLPGVAWAGMALFGALGGSRGLKKLRRRQEVVAA